MSDRLERVAEHTAVTMNRRGFLRRAANKLFAGIAVAAAGAGWTAIMSTAAQAVVNMVCEGASNRGLGCPGAAAGYPCGPSRCCNFIRSGAPANCNCGSGGNCLGQASSPNCFGNDFRFWGTSSASPGCWTCNGPCSGGSRIVTTCCDCKTNASNCKDPDLGSNRGRCIAHSKTTRACP